MTITRKVILPTLLILGIGFLGLLLVQTQNDLRASAATEQSNMEFLFQTWQSRLQAMESFAVALAMETAQNPEVEAAFAAKDRERLTELTLPAYLALDEEFDIPQNQFHLPPATSFLRLHQLDSFGDDLSTFRFTVLEANATNKPVSGLEIGRGGLGMRGVVPVNYQNNHIGTVEFGLNVDQKLLTDLKNQYGVDWQILLRREPAEIATFTGAVANATGPTEDLILQASTLETPFFASTAVYDQVLTNKPIFSNDIKVNNTEYAIYSAPLYDFSQNIIGVVEIVADRTSILQAQSEKVVTTAVLSIFTLAVVGAGLVFITTRILHPIQDLTEAASAIASGDLNRAVPVASNDELGILAKDFNVMTENLKEMLENLEQRVNERTHALETSMEISQRLSNILAQNQLVAEVVEQVSKAFNYYHVHIYVLDKSTNELIMAGGTGTAGKMMLAKGHKILSGRGLVGQAANTGELVMVPDVSQVANWLPNPLLPDTKSEAAVPIIYRAEVLGVLDVQQNSVNGLNEEDAKILQSIASQVAIALHNARLHEEVQARIDRETTINEINRRIRSAGDIDTVLRVAAREIGLAINAQKTSVQLGHDVVEGNGRAELTGDASSHTRRN